MFLLITASPRSDECAARLEAYFDAKTHIAKTVKQAVKSLRTHEYRILIIDQLVADADPSGVDALVHNAGLALPVYINFAISGIDRVLKEVQVASERFERLKCTAMRAAECILRSSIRGEITGILLSSEVALRHADLPGEVAEKLHGVRDLAEQIRTRLETVQ